MPKSVIASLLCLVISASGFGAKDKKKVPVAPLPTVVVNAKKIFLSNGGGSNLAYDAFYAKMKEWGKYEIVGAPDEADLIVELSYRVDKGAHGSGVPPTLMRKRRRYTVPRLSILR